MPSLGLNGFAVSQVIGAPMAELETYTGVFDSNNSVDITITNGLNKVVQSAGFAQEPDENRTLGAKIVNGATLRVTCTGNDATGIAYTVSLRPA